MITIDEIKNISFRKAGRQGYMAEDVDNFIDDVIEAFEQLKKDKTNLVHKIDVLATRVEQYRAEEDTVRNALFAAQKASDVCIKEAKEKAAQIIRDAEIKAQSIVADAEVKIVEEKNKYMQLQVDSANLKNELISTYKKHISLLDELPSTKQVVTIKNDTNEVYQPKSFNTNVVTKVEKVEEVAEPIVEKKIELEVAPVEVAKAVENISSKVEEISSEKIEEKTQEKAEVKEVKNENSPKHSKKTSKRNGRFGRLKFGDNYDVSAD